MNTNIILENYYTIIDKLINEFKGTEDKLFLSKKDFRGQLFAIEGILRLHLKSPENKLSKNENQTLEKVLTETKNLEDFLGAYSLLFELQEYAETQMEKKMKNKFNLEIIKEQNQKFLELKEKIERYQLDAIDHKEELQRIKWPKNEKKFLKKTLNSELKRLDKKVSKKLANLILADKYGYEELEEGFHEFRRAIRWVSIYIQGYKPYFSLSQLPKKLTEDESKIIEEFKNSPFAQLSIGKGLIKINSIQYYKLSYYISYIGKIKNQGEMNYYLSKRGYDLGQEVQIEPLAHKSYNGFIRDEVFKKFIL